MKTDNASQQQMVPEKARLELNPDQILTAEFNYIVQAAFQANEDRARVTSFYLVSVGSFLAAILSTQLLANLQPVVFWSFGVLFLFLAVLAVTTILQLIRLRKSWFESVLAMNQIKEFYINNLENLNLSNAFRWKTASIPTKNRINSLSFYLTVEVGLFGAAAFGAAFFFILLGFGWVSWGPAAVLGTAFFVGEVLFYRGMLRK